METCLVLEFCVYLELGGGQLIGDFLEIVADFDSLQEEGKRAFLENLLVFHGHSTRMKVLVTTLSVFDFSDFDLQEEGKRAFLEILLLFHNHPIQMKVLVTTLSADYPYFPEAFLHRSMSFEESGAFFDRSSKKMVLLSTQIADSVLDHCLEPFFLFLFHQTRDVVHAHFHFPYSLAGCSLLVF